MVIPYANSTAIKHPDYYESSNLIENSKQVPMPGSKDEDNSNAYITAKFLQRSLPYTFPLGSPTNIYKIYKYLENVVKYYTLKTFQHISLIR